MYFAYYSFIYYKVAVFELRKCTLRTRLVLLKLRLSSWSCGSVLRVLDLYYKVGIFELELRKCTSRTRLVLQRCDFRAGCTSRTRLVLQSCDFRSVAAEVYFAY